MDVADFLELLGPPALNSDPNGDWAQFESEKGLELPGDYKRFVSAYGPCEIYSDLYVSHPRGVILSLEGLINRVFSEFEALRGDFPDKYPYTTFPEAGGLLPVAETVAGTQVNLLPPTGGGAMWTVVVNWQGWWSHYPYGFTDFLYRALQFDPEIPLFEEDAMVSDEPPYVMHR